jgi:hypothetical protein
MTDASAVCGRLLGHPRLERLSPPLDAFGIGIGGRREHERRKNLRGWRRPVITSGQSLVKTRNCRRDPMVASRYTRAEHNALAGEVLTFLGERGAVCRVEFLDRHAPPVDP